MKRVLIIGASSFVGANLAVYLRNYYQVIGTYSSHPLHLDGLTHLKLEIRRGAYITELIDQIKPDVTLYCAAITDENECARMPGEALFVNADAPGLFAQAVTKNRGRFIYISTSKIFSGEEGSYGETSPPAARTIYGDTKWKGEERVSVYDNIFILRTGTLFGFGSLYHKSILQRILSNVSKSEKLPLIDDEPRTFMSVWDFAKSVGTVIDSQTNLQGTYHVGPSETHTYFSFGQAVVSVFGLNGMYVVPISGEAFDRGNTLYRGKNLTLDCSTFHKTFVGSFSSIQASLQELKKAAHLGLC